MRPMPKPQPTPVDRMLGGYTMAVLAFSTLWVPIRKVPTASTPQARNQKLPPPLPSTSMASAAHR